MTADKALPGWRGLEGEQRWTWFRQLYAQAAPLDRRYRLGLRSGWWTDDVQIELLAALGAWIGMFDYANWTEPRSQGKADLPASGRAGAAARRRPAVQRRRGPGGVRAPPARQVRLRAARRRSLTPNGVRTRV